TLSPSLSPLFHPPALSHLSFSSFSSLSPPPSSPLFPYTTLFRSADRRRGVVREHLRLRQVPQRADDARDVDPRRPQDLGPGVDRSEEHTSELQSLTNLVCRLLLEKKKKRQKNIAPSRNERHSPAP